MGGAQSHDDLDRYSGGCGEEPGDSPSCFEVTAHYDIDGLEAGHHIYNGSDPASSTTSIWLDATGLASKLPTVAAVEQANAGHTWTIDHAGGPLFITYYDNDYGGNVGPGTRFCIDTTPPPVCTPSATIPVQVPITAPWFDTGVDVVAGSSVTIVASGVVTYGNENAAQVADANGGNFDGTQVFDDDVLPSTVTHSLIGKVGGTIDTDTGSPVPEGMTGKGAGFVGTSYAQTMTASGRLFLGYNDEIGTFSDNAGSFDVTMTIAPPANCAPAK
jgi:hypothetical protein